MFFDFIIKLYLFAVEKKKTFFLKKVQHVKPKRIIIVYRISDIGYLKDKPSYINNENCLKNAVLEFPLCECSWHVIADNISESTLQMVCKYIPQNNIKHVSVGHGAGTFRIAYDYALQYDDDDCVYFLENDYLHKPGSLKVLKEGLQCMIIWINMGITQGIHWFVVVKKLGYFCLSQLIGKLPIVPL